MSKLEGKELKDAITSNPHCKQSLLYNKSIIKCTFSSLQRNMKESDLEESYRRRTNEERTVIHWGQRKLFLSELEFFTLYAKPNDIVLYVGSAPGNHTFFLTLLFPFIEKFILIDPCPFYVKPTEKIEIIQDFFKEEYIQEIKKKYPSSRLLFISDIRSASPLQESEDVVEEKVNQDMQLQMNWVLSLKPRKSMLKFRLSWREGTTEYLDGDIYYQSWGPSTTTETRLITSGKKMKIYSNKGYESKLFYFNTHTRTNLYMHPIKDVEGLDHCYDCASEVYIWKKYIKKYSSSWKFAKKYIYKIINKRKEIKNTKDKQPSKEEISMMKSFSKKTPSQESTDIPLLKRELESDIAEAIIMTHSICSNRRTFMTKLAHPKNRKWFPNKIIENEKIIYK